MRDKERNAVRRRNLITCTVTTVSIQLKGTYHSDRIHGIYNCEQQDVVGFGVVLTLTTGLVGVCVVPGVSLENRK